MYQATRVFPLDGHMAKQFLDILNNTLLGHGVWSTLTRYLAHLAFFLFLHRLASLPLLAHASPLADTLCDTLRF